MMYALKCHGMFIRESDGLCTQNKSAAKLFNTVDDAKDYLVSWRATSEVNQASTVAVILIEVETKPVMHKFIKEVAVLGVEE